MDHKVLVAYASTHGSTQEIAEFVAAVLREQGLEAELLPARNVRSLDGYAAVVLGAPLYMFHLHKDAQRFLSRFQKALAGGVPVAIFAGGPFAPAEEKTWQEVRQQLDQELAKFPWLRPAAVEVVGGRFDPNHLRFPWNLVPALKQMQPSDLRNWDAIRAWAAGLPAQIGHPTQEGQPAEQETAH
ncbi:MAG TPA: flavodoxin domain-containing protein [Anaerolineaceae bacterium]|nr:flavodoxin domain-containing protein [Anaerolineaceae bacterium]